MLQQKAWYKQPDRKKKINWKRNKGEFKIFKNSCSLEAMKKEIDVA